MTKLVKIEGIGQGYAQKLELAGIWTTEALLDHGASVQGRKELSEDTGINPNLILRWVNHVDLFRINGIGEQYAELLEAAGVDTVPELATRNPSTLHQKLVEVNQDRKLVRKTPSEAQVKNWIGQAKELPRKITY